jgi:PAS domain S-box-containing protein
MSMVETKAENIEYAIKSAISRASFDGIVVHDGGSVVRVNEQAARMFRVNGEEIIGRHISEFIDPEKREAQLAQMARKGARRFESSGLRGDGSTFPLNVSVAPVDGSSLRVVVMRDLSEQRQVENEVRLREERFRALEAAAFDGLVCEGAHGIDEINESFSRTFGYTSDELRGRRFADLIVSPAGNGSAEAAIRRKDGSLRTVQLCTAATPGGERILAVRDVTEDRQARTEVLESERRYRDLSESTHDLLCLHDLDGRITEINPAAARSLGYTQEEVCGMNLRDLLIGRARPAFQAYLDAVTRNGMAEGMMTVRTRNGEPRVWHYQNALQTVAGHSFVRGLARDVTDRELALEELRTSEHHFRSIIENVSDLVTLIDATGTICYTSPSVTRALGFSEREVNGHTFHEFVHPDDAAAAGAVFQRQLGELGAVGSLDARILHGDGAWRWYSIVVTNRVSDGQVRNVIVNARDITERRLLLAQLEQANRVNGLGRLAATVAHEFNNVLMGMQPFAELIQRPRTPPDIAARGAGYIASSIARGKRVALDILRFTQPAQPTLMPIALDTWWERLLPEVKAGTENTIQLAWTFAPGLAVVADEQQLSQVFSNLISNARHAMPAGGRLSITARRPLARETFAFGVINNPESFVQISVTDTGYGIAPDIIGSIFDPLFTTKSNGGTGLGLAVVHQIMANHGGAIFAESTPGVGSTFHAFFRAAGTVAADESAPLAAPQLNVRARVLIIEDEEAVAAGLSELLMGEGLTTAIATTIAEGELEAERFRPDSALIDVGLPDGDGAELAARLYARYPKLRIVIMSGHANASGALPDGTTIRFLQKPFSITALLQMLDGLERREAR